ncbi:DUF1326 domain-containing protein [soil metagenome]
MDTRQSVNQIEWRVAGQEATSCNCAWGCPCQFNSLPTYGFCEALVALDIQHGHFGDTPLDGVKYAQVFHWDGAVHEGNGWRKLIVDEDATPDQQAAIEALTSGAHGHPYYEIFSAMAPNTQETVVASIEFACDQEQRMAHILIPDIAESEIEPIRNPVTGKEHRARIDLPNGFEYKVAEVGNSVNWQTTAGDHLTMKHENTYAQLARVDWSSDGTSR